MGNITKENGSNDILCLLIRDFFSDSRQKKKKENQYNLRVVKYRQAVLDIFDRRR